MRLGLRNLARVWTNYAAAGAERLIIVDVVQRRDDANDYQRAVSGAKINLVRLRASVETLHRRLEGRQVGSAWNGTVRVPFQAAHMERDNVDDIVVDTEGKTVLVLAAEMLQRAGWAVQASNMNSST